MDNLEFTLRDLETYLFYYQNGAKSYRNQIIHILHDTMFPSIVQSFDNYGTTYTVLYNLLNKFEQKYVIDLLFEYLIEKNEFESIIVYENTNFSSITVSEFDRTKAIQIISSFYEKRTKTHAMPFETNIVVSEIDDEYRIKFFACLEGLISASFNNPDWSDIEFGLAIVMLEIYRKVAKSKSEIDFFYFLPTILLERAISGNQYNLIANIIDIILKLSFSDNICEFGFYLRSRLCRRKGDLLGALLTQSLMLNKIILNKKINENLYRLFHEEALELADMSKNYEKIEYLFELTQKRFNYTSHHDIALHYKYFIYRLKFRFDENFIFKIINYAERNEKILYENFAYQYANLFLSIDKNYPYSKYKSKIRSLLLNVSEHIEKLSFSKLENQYTGSNLNSLVQEFNKLFSQLVKTKNHREFETIIKTYYGQIYVLHDNSVFENNLNGYLVAMIFKTDLGLSQRYINEQNNEGFEKLNAKDLTNYVDYFKEKLNIRSKNAIFVWLSSNFDKLFCLLFLKNEFITFEEIKDLTFETLQNWIFEIEQQHDKKVNFKIKLNQFKGIQLNIASENAEEIFIIKDGILSAFPHNLLIDEKKEYIILSKPITNIISSEWFTKHEPELINKVSINAYLPTEGDDEEIIEVYNNERFKKIVKKHQISVVNSIVPSNPLEGSINIIVAHGASNISDFISFSTGKISVIDVDKVIGNGKIAILFICKAGTLKMDDYTHKINSFIRFLFLKNYETVIAPAWDLFTVIPPIWLEEFLDKMNENHSVSNAFQLATKKTYSVYQDPSYWACLHLYGNPYLKYTTIE